MDKKDITEIKSLSKPPVSVQYSMAAVAILFGKPHDWDSCRKLLANVGEFINNIQRLDYR